MGTRHIDAWNRVQLKERSKILYFFKYTLKRQVRNLFYTDFPEELLRTAFDAFYRRYKNNNDPVTESEFKEYEDFEEANDLYLEIASLLDYWNCRDLSPIDRVLDDQMFIRLIKIRHKLRFDIN
jgi:hypothetical protein